MSQFWILHNGVWKNSETLIGTYMLNNFGQTLQGYSQKTASEISVPVGNALGYYKGFDFPELENCVLGFSDFSDNLIVVKLPVGLWKYSFETTTTPATTGTGTTPTTTYTTTGTTTATTTTSTDADETKFEIWQIVKPVGIALGTITILYLLYKRFFSPAKERQTIRP